MSQKYSTYAAFFPFYLAEHSRPDTRAMHYFGTALGLLLFVAAVTTRNFWLVPAAFVTGYGFAFLAHHIFEKNRPATFTYPLWSFRADFHMFWLWLTGQLGETLKQHKIVPRAPDAGGAGA